MPLKGFESLCEKNAEQIRTFSRFRRVSFFCCYGKKTFNQGVKSETGSDAETADLVGKKAGDSGRKVQRYFRLTELLPELLELVDRGKIKVSPAVSLYRRNIQRGKTGK